MSEWRSLNDPVGDHHSDSVYNIVREYFPNVDDATANSILWSCTGWPCFFNIGKIQITKDDIHIHLRDQLCEMSKRSNGDADAARMLAMNDLDNAMLKYKREFLDDMHNRVTQES